MSTEKTPSFPPLKKGDDVLPGWEDFHNQWLLADSFIYMMQDMSISIGPASKIIDLGTGLGKFPEILRRMGYEYAFGVDISQRGKPGPDIVARIEQLPFTDGSIDFITASSVFDAQVYNQDETLMLKEIARVLKPGGIFYSFSNTFNVTVPASLKIIPGTSGAVPMYKKT
ncbi:MAG: class I SAM-dependent methyltransferase [Minisyncoccia bacterium]